MGDPLTISVVVQIRTGNWWGISIGPWFLGLAKLSPFPPTASLGEPIDDASS